MVFTEDLGNCSLTVRTTSASNAGPADGFVRRTFNETPGDGILVPSCFCRLSSFVPLSLFLSSFPLLWTSVCRPRSSYDPLLCQFALRTHATASPPMVTCTITIRDLRAILRGVVFPVLLSASAFSGRP